MKNRMLCKSRICLKAWIVQFEHGDWHRFKIDYDEKSFIEKSAVDATNERNWIVYSLFSTEMIFHVVSIRFISSIISSRWNLLRIYLHEYISYFISRKVI